MLCYIQDINQLLTGHIGYIDTQNVYEKHANGVSKLRMKSNILCKRLTRENRSKLSSDFSSCFLFQFLFLFQPMPCKFYSKQF